MLLQGKIHKNRVNARYTSFQQNLQHIMNKFSSRKVEFLYIVSRCRCKRFPVTWKINLCKKWSTCNADNHSIIPNTGKRNGYLLLWMKSHCTNRFLMVCESCHCLAYQTRVISNRRKVLNIYKMMEHIIPKKITIPKVPKFYGRVMRTSYNLWILKIGVWWWD